MRIAGFISLAALSVALSGCVTTTTDSFGARSSREQANACIRQTHDVQYRSNEEWRSGKTAPQIMTYDPNSQDQTTLTQTENGVDVTTTNQTQRTRLKTTDDKFSFSATNGKSTAVGIKGTTRESEGPISSWRNAPEVCREGGPHDELDGTITGAIIGAAVGATAARPAEGAAVGAVVGAVVGSAVTKGD
jgi:outer membrane lipoprotein SlyB